FKIAAVATEGKRLVEVASNVTGSTHRLLDAKLQETGDKLCRLEQRLGEVHRRLALIEDTELETKWVERCLADFDKVWDTLTHQNRARLVRAIVARIDVDEPNNNVQAFLADVAPSAEEISQAIEEANP
ncbi:MAG: hypothetical protein V2A73_01205, partial [Pseudomonadota bacterium]